VFLAFFRRASFAAITSTRRDDTPTCVIIPPNPCLHVSDKDVSALPNRFPDNNLLRAPTRSDLPIDLGGMFRIRWSDRLLAVTRCSHRMLKKEKKKGRKEKEDESAGPVN